MPEHDEATYLIRVLLAQSQSRGILASHRWPDESERWEELAHAMLHTVLPLPDHHLRALVDRLAALDLLSIPAWSALEPDARLLERFGEVLAAEGIEEDATVARAAGVIREAARSLTTRYGGKVQKCLRQIGNQAVDTLVEAFAVPSLEREALREGLIVWLQNVTNLPIPLADRPVREFCTEQGVSVEELVDAADARDLNVAVLDDLVDAWQQVRAEEVPEEPADG